MILRLTSSTFHCPAQTSQRPLNFPRPLPFSPPILTDRGRVRPQVSSRSSPALLPFLSPLVGVCSKLSTASLDTAR